MTFGLIVVAVIMILAFLLFIFLWMVHQIKQPRQTFDPAAAFNPSPELLPGHSTYYNQENIKNFNEIQRRDSLQDVLEATRRRAKAEQHANTILQAKSLIVDRIAFLRVAKSKAVTRWGEVDAAAWQAAINDFVTAVLLPRLGPKTTLTWKEAIALIEDALSSNERRTSSTAPMTPLEFEKHCATLLQEAGWTVQTTKASGDQGADVVASKDSRRAVLQCKLYSRPVGNGAVQEAAAARDYYKADLAVVVTNAGFTSAARDLAAATRVRLLAPEQLAAL